MPAPVVLSAFGAGSYDSATGDFISNEHRTLARVINDVYPHFSVAYIPRSEGADMAQFPFAIIDNSSHGKQVIRYITAEQMREPSKILAWLFNGDLIRHGKKNLAAKMELEFAAEEALRLKAWADESESRQDLLAFGASGGRDKKHTINYGNGRKVERG